MSRQEKWSDDELLLLDTWAGRDVDLAQRLGRSVTAIRKRRWRRTHPQAVEKEREYAKQNHERLARLAYLRARTHRDLLNADARGRAAAERAVATATGAYQPAEDAVILRLDLSAGMVAARLGRTTASVRQRRRKLLARQSLLADKDAESDQ